MEEFVTREIFSVRRRRICYKRNDLSPGELFRPGEFIYNNITYAVRNSKMTVLILSRNFLETEWCLLEFRTAYKGTEKDESTEQVR